MLKAIEQRQAGILTYGITPPKKAYDEARRTEVAARQQARIAQLPVDGLVVYDIQDESARTSEARPFPYLECIDPVEYAYDYLAELELSKIVYRCVAPQTQDTLSASLQRIADNDGLSVFVGSASRNQEASMRLPEAYRLRQTKHPHVPLGGVLIAERHSAKRGEDERMMAKVSQGCSFFITQAVYSVVESKNVLSDLHYRALDAKLPLPPILVTLSPCGSQKTLEFMRWLGVSVPRWLENELIHAQDILQTSVDICVDVFEDLYEFAKERGIPLGCNIESVSLRKAEIEASVELVHRIAAICGRTPS